MSTRRKPLSTSCRIERDRGVMTAYRCHDKVGDGNNMISARPLFQVSLLPTRKGKKDSLELMPAKNPDN